MNKYLTKNYLHIPRLMAYLEQYKYIEDEDNILEIGNAGGVFQEIALKIASYKSLDIDLESNPDFVFDISALAKKEKNKIGQFNKVFCCEVLEHIPFDKFENSLRNLFDLSRDLVVISIPDNRKYVRMAVYFWKFSIKNIFSVPFTGRLINKNNHEEHHFEIFSKNYNEIKEEFKKISKEKKFNMISEYRFFERPYQHFFIFKKIK